MMAWVPSVRSALRRMLRGPDVDVVLAFIAFAVLLIDPLATSQVKELTPLDAGLALVTAVPLVLRRRYPLGVLVAIVPLLLVCLAVFHPDRAAAGIVMVVVFTVGLHGHRARARVVGALMAPVVAAGVLITSHRLGSDSVAETVAYLALVLGALVAGDAVRARQELVRVLAEEAERERAALAQHRFDEQRLRYAHELHDVVGHALVAINVRASAAAHLARRQEGVSPVTALEEIASASAEALGELRTALKGLRSDESEGVPLRPAGAGLADLDDLIAGVKGAGLTVELDMAAIEAVPPAIGHAGYRIVQEGLTNVLRHSTARHARVRIGQDEGALLVEVLDNGQTRAATSTGGSGHGLLGMREAGFQSVLSIESDITVVGEARNGAEAVTLARDEAPDVVLMDIRMPELDGLEATRLITSDPRLRRTRVVVLTTFDLDEYVFGALQAGASGFLLKGAEPAVLVEAVRTVARGDALLEPGATRRLIEAYAHQQHADQAAAAKLALPGSLTSRELEILALIAGGLTNSEIAARLFISPLTCKSHVSRILTKLDARDRTQLVVIAYESGLVVPGQPPR